MVRLIEGDLRDDKSGEEGGDRERLGDFLSVMEVMRVLGGVSFFPGSAGGGEVTKESEVGLDTLAEPTTEGEPLVITRPEGTEILLLLTLAESEGIDVDALLIGGTGVALGDLAGMFLMVVLPLALEEALGFEVMVKRERTIGICRTIQSLQGVHGNL